MPEETVSYYMNKILTCWHERTATLAKKLQILENQIEELKDANRKRTIPTSGS